VFGNTTKNFGTFQQSSYTRFTERMTKDRCALGRPSAPILWLYFTPPTVNTSRIPRKEGRVIGQRCVFYWGSCWLREKERNDSPTTTDSRRSGEMQAEGKQLVDRLVGENLSSFFLWHDSNNNKPRSTYIYIKWLESPVTWKLKFHIVDTVHLRHIKLRYKPTDAH
jgi:hypothetical protein